MSGEGSGPGLPAGKDLAAALEVARDSGRIGHSAAAHAVHGWCSLCPDRTERDELAAWRYVANVHAAITEPAYADGHASTVVIDFDGPLHDYLDGWKDGTVYGNPVEGSGDALEIFMAGYAVVIGTARADLGAVAAAIRRWYNVQTVIDTPAGRCQFWTVRGAVLVTNRKLPAVAYVDDRAYRFVPGAGDAFGWQPLLGEFIHDHGWLSEPGPAVFRVPTGNKARRL